MYDDGDHDDLHHHQEARISAHNHVQEFVSHQHIENGIAVAVKFIKFEHILTHTHTLTHIHRANC